MLHDPSQGPGSVGQTALPALPALPKFGDRNIMVRIAVPRYPDKGAGWSWTPSYTPVRLSPN